MASFSIVTPVRNKNVHYGEHMVTLNTYNAAGASRRQDQNVTNLVTNVNILELGYYIWNPYEKCIQKSPNMSGIGSLICEIDVKFQKFEKQTYFLLSKINARIVSIIRTPFCQ